MTASESNRKWNIAHPEKMREAARKYYYANREKIIERNRRYRAERPGSRKEEARKYYLKNKEKHQAASRKWAKDNAEKFREYRAKWEAENPDLAVASKKRYREQNKERYRLHCASRRARRKAATVQQVSEGEWRAIKEAYKHRCAYCSKRKKLTMDHIIPLAKGGVHAAWNILPACLSCNSSKGVKEAPTYQPVLFI